MKTLVMLIDDDPVVNFINSRILSKYGPSGSPEIFEGAQPAFRFLAGNHQNYDSILILLDINMPEMNGWQLLEKMSSTLPDLLDKTFVFILSSSAAEEDMQKSKEYSLVKGYVMKPLNAEKCDEILSHEEVSDLF